MLLIARTGFSQTLYLHDNNEHLQENAGGGLVFWHPKGSKIRHKI